MKHRSPKNSFCGLPLCNFLATGNLLKRAGSKVFVEELAMVISYYNSAIYLNIRTVSGHYNFNKTSSVLYPQISTFWFLLRHTVLCALEIAPITTRVVSWGSSTWFRSGQMGPSNEIRASISSQIKRQPNWPVVFKTNGHSSSWL